MNSNIPTAGTYTGAIIKNRVGINSEPGDWTHRDPRTHGDSGSLYTLQLVLSTSASSLAANPLFAHHTMFIN